MARSVHSFAFSIYAKRYPLAFLLKPKNTPPQLTMYSPADDPGSGVFSKDNVEILDYLAVFYGQYFASNRGNQITCCVRAI